MRGKPLEAEAAKEDQPLVSRVSGGRSAATESALHSHGPAAR
jgi:hypothetical protein